MNTFVMHLQSTTQYERIDRVESFMGEDDSGNFGVLSGHARMMTLLGFGLARFRVTHRPWEFVAIPGAVLYFVNDELFISTRHYLRGQDYDQITRGLRQELLAEEEALHEMKQSIRRLEEEMFRRLWKVGRSGEPLA